MRFDVIKGMVPSRLVAPLTCKQSLACKAPGQLPCTKQLPGAADAAGAARKGRTLQSWGAEAVGLVHRSGAT